MQSLRYTGGAVIQYVYDAEGARIAKGTLAQAPAAGATCAPPLGSGFTLTARYLVDMGGDQVTELSEQGPPTPTTETWAHSNLWAGGKLTATYDPRGIHFEITDPLGTKRVQANALGQVDEQCTSLPFGNDVNNPVAANCTAVANSLGTNDDATEHHFTQKERDTETGNDYFFARYYNSAIGRFTTPDWSAKVEPIPYAQMGDPQSLNLYAYVRNNPIVHVDKDGHCFSAGWCHLGGNDPLAQAWFAQSQKNASSAAASHDQLAQQQNGTVKKTGFWHGLSNLFHGHSWGFMREEVTSRILPASESEPNGYVTAATDIASVAALGSEKAAKVLGPVGAAVSAVNDPSPYNLTVTGLGFVPRVAEPVGFISAESDYLNWEFQTWFNGAINAEAIKAGQRNSEMGIAPSPGERMGDCPLNMCN